MLYELKLRVKRINEKGEEKDVTEQYITDVNLFAEAECKGLEIYKGECEVIAITRSNVREIVNPERDGVHTFYRATIVDIYTNDNGDEKELKYHVLVLADSLQEATNLVQNYMKQGLQDMRLDGVVKTKILDII